MAKKQGPTIIEMTEAELNALRERIKSKQLTEDDCPIIKQTIQFVLWVQIQLVHAKITMSKFKQMLFGSKTEKNKRSKNDPEPDSKKEESLEPPANNTLNNPEGEKPGETLVCLCLIRRSGIVLSQWLIVFTLCCLSLKKWRLIVQT